MIDDVNQEAWLAVFEYLRLQKKSLPAAGTSEELQQKYKHVHPLVSQYKRFSRIREYRRMNHGASPRPSPAPRGSPATTPGA